MIIDFTISNFRSIKNEQVFSLFAESKSEHLSGNVAYPNQGKIGVLKTAGIYGANASGKSNLLKAFEALKYIACISGDLKDGDKIPCYEPYLLCDENENAPVAFEIEFFAKDGLRYIYKVSFLSHKIISESLDFYPSRQKANLFTREENDSWEEITFGGLYKGGRKKIAFFDNNTYLSKAGNSADAPELIRNIYNYFRNDMLFVGLNQQVSMPEWTENTQNIQKISSILSKVDTGINNVKYEDRDMSGFRFPTDLPKEVLNRLVKSLKKKPVFFHEGEEGKTSKFTEEMESDGTLRIFNMFPMIIEAIDDGSVLILDELEHSLHTHLAELIIKIFNDERLNTKGAQLIFSTHNVSLMSPENLRRDQVWIAEKESGVTTLVSLEDFDKNLVKIDSPFGRWYDDGRFGGIPKINYKAISDILSLNSENKDA